MLCVGYKIYPSHTIFTKNLINPLINIPDGPLCKFFNGTNFFYSDQKHEHF